MPHPNVKDLRGRTFGRLKVIDHAPRPADAKGRGAHWQCFCECGAVVYVRSDSLVQGKSTSCGCADPNSTHARSFIGPRTKPAVSEQPQPVRTEFNPQANLSMHMKDVPFSNTIPPAEVSVSVNALLRLRAEIKALDPQMNLKPTRVAMGLVNEMLPATPSSYANENDQPRNALREINPLNTVAAPVTMADVGLLVTKTMTPGEIEDFVEAFKTSPLPGARTPLRFADPSDVSKRKHSHYFRDVSNLDVMDIYRLLELFNVTDNALGHAIKKLILPGMRGANDMTKDVQEAIDTLTRWQEMRREDMVKSRHAVAREEGRA